MGDPQLAKRPESDSIEFLFPTNSVPTLHSAPDSALHSPSTSTTTSTPVANESRPISTFATPSGASFKSRYGPSSNPKTVAPFTFGQRLLSSEDNVWDYNAWDHATPDPDYLHHMSVQLSAQKSKPVSSFDKKRFHAHPDKFWNKFYTNNATNFFKDRKWLGQEFPLLRDACQQNAPPMRVLEVGAGAGNTLFPVLKQNQSPEFHITAADFSAVSVDLIRTQPEFISNYPKHVDAKVWDLADPDPLHLPCPKGSLDIVILIFVFSALAPWQWKTAVGNVKSMLKSGGSVLFRDYGKGDLAQVRMKGGRWLGENFYVRGDGTRVYFFEQDEVQNIFEERWENVKLERWEEEKKLAVEGGAVGPWGGKLDRNRWGLGKQEDEQLQMKDEEEVEDSRCRRNGSNVEGTIGSREGAETDQYNNPNQDSPLLQSSSPLLQQPAQSERTQSQAPLSAEEKTAITGPNTHHQGRLQVSKIGTDRRMLLNRKRQIKMYRCWLQMQCEKKLEGMEEEEKDVLVRDCCHGSTDSHTCLAQSS